MLNEKKNRIIHLEISSRCRLFCSKCSRNIEQYKNSYKPINTDMDFNIFKQIVLDKKTKHILFCGNYGDPIYHPQFIEFVEFAKSKKIKLTIHTNGSGKTDQWWLSLFKLLRKEDKINFNIDGFKHTVGLYRVNFTENDFNQIINLIKLALKEYNFQIVWQMIIFKFNEDQLFEAASFAIDNKIPFCFRISSRWNKDNDPLIPNNINLTKIEANSV